MLNINNIKYKNYKLLLILKVDGIDIIIILFIPEVNLFIL